MGLPPNGLANNTNERNPLTLVVEVDYYGYGYAYNNR
jgi:hypothetical protein